MLWSHNRAEDSFFVSRRWAVCLWAPSGPVPAVEAVYLISCCCPCEAAVSALPTILVEDGLGLDRPHVCADGFSLLETSAAEAALTGLGLPGTDSLGLGGSVRS